LHDSSPDRHRDRGAGAQRSNQLEAHRRGQDFELSPEMKLEIRQARGGAAMVRMASKVKTSSNSISILYAEEA
jgi:hypothetical protein